MTIIREVQVKGILNPVQPPDEWFGLRYNMNLYRGCQHQCIYCDSRSECYQIEDFNREVLIKTNAVELLEQKLARTRVKGVIGFGSMNDPYMPVEAQYNLTGRALEVIARFRFPVHILTKSDLVLRDLPVLKRIAAVYAAVSFTITAADDDLARLVEPGAPSSSRRFAALHAVRQQGIHGGVLLMPVLPYIEDNADNIRRVVEKAHASGAEYILPAFGMTLRDRQRDHYYRKLDEHFPGLRPKYEQRYGERYSARAPGAEQLEREFTALCRQYGIATRMPRYAGGEPAEKQLELL